MPLIKNKFHSADTDSANNNSLLTHIVSLPGFDVTKARFATQYSTRSSPEKSVLEIVPTAAELMLPWRRDLSYQSFGTFIMQLSAFFLVVVSLSLFEKYFYIIIYEIFTALSQHTNSLNMEIAFGIISYRSLISLSFFM